MKKTALLLIILTVLSKIFGFGRELVLSYFYGASSISDAYIIALTIPMIVFAFIGKGISTAYIPMYTNIEKNIDTNEADKYTNNLVNLLLIICTFIVVLGIMFTEKIVIIFASGFEGDLLSLTVQFTRISLIGIYFTAIVHVFSAFLQMKGNYAIPALVGFPMNLCIIFSIILSNSWTVEILAIGIVVATAAQFIFLMPFVLKKNFKYAPIFDMKDSNIRHMANLGLPVIIGVALNDINKIIDKTLASQIAEGGISALNYASRLNAFVQGIIVISIVTAMYPMISTMVVDKKLGAMKKLISEGIICISILILPATIGAMIFAQPIVILLFGRGAFGESAIIMTSKVLFFYASSMLFYGLREVVSRAFFAMKDTKTPVINASIGVVTNIILNIVLSRYMGLSGLALATSIAMAISAILMFISLQKKIGPFGFKEMGSSFLKITIASLLMGVISKAFFQYLRVSGFTQNIALFLAIAIGAVAYFTCIYFMRIKEVDFIVNMIKRKK